MKKQISFVSKVELTGKCYIKKIDFFFFFFLASIDLKPTSLDFLLNLSYFFSFSSNLSH